MTAVVLQARLDSTRLPGKALLDLGGKPVISRVMENLRNVDADEYVLACDYDSFQKLSPLAEEAGFKCISGPKEDVLERFALVIREIKADIIVRATGDNPFLFADAAAASVSRFKELCRTQNADYFTYTGLPHGSGVEIMSAGALLKAAGKSGSPYEREHVGPSLYLHKDEYTCIFEKAPEQWFHPDLRTTIDTARDYSRACRVADFVISEKQTFPFLSSDITGVFDFVLRPVVFVPASGKNCGTGHLRRTFSSVLDLRRSWNCFIYIPGLEKDVSVKKKISALLMSFPEDDRNFLEKKICAAIPLGDEKDAVYRFVLDNFRTTKEEMLFFLKRAPVIAVDEGGDGRVLADYVFDVIPSLRNAPGKNISAGNMKKALAEPNRFSPGCVPLPENPGSRKTVPGRKVVSVLVVAGGADEAGEAVPYGKWFASCGFKTTVVSSSGFPAPGLKVVGYIHDLSSELKNYDLVATHFGFAAFEALASGCQVALFAPTKYHEKISRAYGFPVLPELRFSAEPEMLRRFVDRLPDVPPVRGACAGYLKKEYSGETYSAAVSALLSGKSFNCAFCGSKFTGGGTGVGVPSQNKPRGFRFGGKTVQACPRCGTMGIRYSLYPEKKYRKEYFFGEYEKQYGKTYLQDFESIRRTGMRRMKEISKAAGKSVPGFSSSCEKNILDVGCAFGPFLSAAAASGWKPFGTDISGEAVKYVREHLCFPAVTASFPDFDPSSEPEGKSFPALFTAVTFWYVIEHFENLPDVFKKVKELLVPGGILAVSTPSCAGISARRNKRGFFEASPSDHFSVWDPLLIKKQLKAFGFRVVKIVVTGHHPERFPCGSLPGFLKRVYLPLCALISRILKLGDTFEIYAEKMKTEE